MAGTSLAMTDHDGHQLRKLLALKIPDAEHTYTDKDTMLYALGVGLGHDPLDAEQLDFVYEKNLKALPTFAAVLGYPGFWVRDLDTGIDWVKIVNGEQGVVLHQPVKPAGTVIGRTPHRRGDRQGRRQGRAGLHRAQGHRQSERRADRDRDADHVLPRRRRLRRPAAREPAGAQDCPSARPILLAISARGPEQAMIYRLSADRNPLHVDPEVAKAAGYPRPILHGLGTFGVVGHALLKSVCGYDPTRVRSFAGRFSAPVFPGETIRTEFWRDGDVVSFRASVPDRNVVVMNNGRAEVTP